MQTNQILAYKSELMEMQMMHSSGTTGCGGSDSSCCRCGFHCGNSCHDELLMWLLGGSFSGYAQCGC